jgi:hypothetical protein
MAGVNGGISIVGLIDILRPLTDYDVSERICTKNPAEWQIGGMGEKAVTTY